MEYYLDISTDRFEKIRDHQTLDLCLSKEEAIKASGKKEEPFFKIGDGLKLYHPSDFPEALRVEIESINETDDADQVCLTIRLNEWMMSFPDDQKESDDFGAIF